MLTANHSNVQLLDVSVRYKSAVETVTALDGVTLDLRGGEFLAVLGASGSGKTTLLNVIAGLQVPHSGSVSVAGQQIETLNSAKRARIRLERVGVVFQDHNLIQEFSAAENIEVPLRARGFSAQESRKLAGESLNLVGLPELGRRKPAQLSGGQRQRVGIARALAGGRQILVADEPTGSLDGTNSIAIFNLLSQLSSQGIAVIAATHDPEVHKWADRIVTMHDGAIKPRVVQTTEA